MKKKMIVTTVVTALLLTGCGYSVPDLSKLDNRKASEYLAGELLKHDSSYQYALDYDHSILEPTPVPTVAPTPVPSADSKKNDPNATDNGDEGGSEEPAMQEVALSDIFGVSGTEVTFVSSGIKSSLGEEYAYYRASKGKKLLLAYFRIKNTGKEDKTVNLSDGKIQYQLLVDGASAGNLQRTIAQGDMQYFKQNIKAGKSKQGILVFEVDKGLSINNASIAIVKDGRQATVALK